MLTSSELKSTTWLSSLSELKLATLLPTSDITVSYFTNEVSITDVDFTLFTISFISVACFVFIGVAGGRWEGRPPLGRGTTVQTTIAGLNDRIEASKG